MDRWAGRAFRTSQQGTKNNYLFASKSVLTFQLPKLGWCQYCDEQAIVGRRSEFGIQKWPPKLAGVQRELHEYQRIMSEEFQINSTAKTCDQQLLKGKLNISTGDYKFLTDSLQIKDETGLDAVLHRNPDLKHLDLSATGISGSVFKNIENPLRRIRELYLDFCPKLDLQMLKQGKDSREKSNWRFGVDKNFLELAIFPGLKMISIFGIAVEQTGDLRFDHHELREIVTSSGEETEEEIRTFANYRRLRLNNWMVTKKHLFKGVPMLFSQINLTSFADRDHS